MVHEEGYENWKTMVLMVEKDSERDDEEARKGKAEGEDYIPTSFLDDSPAVVKSHIHGTCERSLGSLDGRMNLHSMRR